jgi:hypothetical protein
MKRIVLILTGLPLVLLTLSGCGNGGSSKLQQKTATITFSTVSSAHTAPLQGIQIALKLPDGASIADINTAVTGHNSSGRVIPGAVSGGTATFAVTQANFVPPFDFISFGDFASLTCTILPGATLSQGSFAIAPGDIQMTGKDSSGTTVDLTGIPVKLSVSFGY